MDVMSDTNKREAMRGRREERESRRLCKSMTTFPLSSLIFLSQVKLDSYFEASELA